MVELHQVAFGPTAVKPGVAEVVPEAVREHVDAALISMTWLLSYLTAWPNSTNAFRVEVISVPMLRLDGGY